MDSGRWQDFPLRDGDVIITTPSKCGTTWMQTIVGMLILGRVDLGRQMGLLSPWLDMLTRSREEIFQLLDAQTHRRFIKTHTPLDGLPLSDAVTYLAVVRHPLDAALSNKDHNQNMSEARLLELVTEAGEAPVLEAPRPPAPEDPADYLRWWIDDEGPPKATGLANLAEYAHQVTTYWQARHRPNVHLFHYTALQSNLDPEMRRVATALGIPLPEPWDAYVQAATLDAMRARAAQLVPEAHHERMWTSVEGFFKSGGRRNWPDLLTPTEVAHYHHRLATLLTPEAAHWATG